MDFSKLQQHIGYAFQNQELLERALTHGSSKTKDHTKDNEVLEFIGDAFLQLAVASLLIKAFPGADEGMLTIARSQIVNRRALQMLGEQLELPNFIITGGNIRAPEEMAGTAIIANSCEALFGALYLDAGYEKAVELCESILRPALETASEEVHPAVHDLKTKFFNYCRKNHGIYPNLIYEEDLNAPEDQRYVVQVFLKGNQVAHSRGKSKKGAVHNALLLLRGQYGL